MKLASFHDGSRDGQLAVVSRDLGSACYASGIAATLQQALQDWNFIAPQLQTLSDALNSGHARHARHAFAFDPALCLAPLPRAFQWALASCAPEESAPPGHAPDGAAPALFLAAGDTLRGPCGPLPALPGALDFEPQLAAIVADAPRAATADQGQDAIRLLALACPLRLREAPWADSCPATAFAPVALTPDELGPAWQAGVASLTLQASLNGRKTGLLDTRRAWPLGQLAAACARTRALTAGSLLGAGPTPAASGHSSIQQRRASGLQAAWLQAGDALHLQARAKDGAPLFGAIDLRLS